jgi:RNA polymerase sigma-70 factor (ECF subfamily)
MDLVLDMGGDRRMPLQELEDERVAAVYATQIDRVVALGCLLTGNPSEAEDLAQEVFTGIVQRSRREPGFLREPTWPWLRLAMVRLAMRRRRQLAAEVRRMMRLYQLPADEPWAGDSLDYVAAIKRLPARMRTCVVLFYQEDLSTAQVAETMGCSAKTVENQLRDARHRLATALRLDDGAEPTAVGVKDARAS